METRYGFRLQRSGTNRILALVLALTLAITAVAPASAQEPAAEPGNETPLYLPSILDNKCYQLRTLSRYGVQLYGATGESTILHNDLVASGASFIRNEISWAGAEPTNTTPDKYNWAGIDSVAAVVGQGCYNMVMTILGNPLWAAPDVEGVIPAENLPEFAEFMGVLWSAMMAMASTMHRVRRRSFILSYTTNRTLGRPGPCSVGVSMARNMLRCSRRFTRP